MIYRFGDCEVDTKLLELRRAGSAHAMDPLGFDLLVYLIENRDRVLTRDELLDALWPGKVVTDSALSSRLKSVRSAVGDTGSAQKIIKTVHGRGYRFVAGLNDVPADSPVPGPSKNAGPGQANTPAVGRDSELGKLSRWLDRSIGNERNVVFVSGEAGVGKTTLARAFLHTARNQADVFVMHGQCVDQRGASEAYLPLLEAIGRAGQLDADVRALIHQHAPAWLANLPSLAENAGEAAADVQFGVTAGRMLRELSELLNLIAAKRNVILVLEDLHWSDTSTTGWIEYFTRRNDRARLMLIATFRPDASCLAVCRELATRGLAHHMPLDSIEESYVTDYLTHRLDHPPSPELAALAYRRTEGFPLFIDTLVDHWLERGLIHRPDGFWSAAGAEEELLANVPEDLAQLIEQQLLGLTDEQRKLFETAALAGTPFAAASIACALDEAEENIESILAHEARLGRFVRNAGDVRWPDGTVTGTFEFRHELYRAALHDRIPASRRARLHRAIGERLEQAFGDESGPIAGEIADHFARAHEAGRALRYFYPAALLTFNRSAYREAVAMVDRALAMIRTLPASNETWRVERDLHLLRASACIFLEGWSSERVEESYVRAQDLASRLDLKVNAPETFGIAAMFENRGQYTESQATIESLMERSADRDLGLEAHELLACSLFHQGRFDQAKQNADRVNENYDPGEASAILVRYGENPGVSCHNWAALSLQFMGYPESARRRSDKAIELASGHVYSTCSALTLRTHLHQFRNEPEETLAWAERTRELATKQGFAYRVAQLMILRGWAAGRLATAADEQHQSLAAMDQGIKRLGLMGSEMDLPHHLTLKSELLAHMGELDEAIAVQQAAIEANPEDRDFFYEAEMLRHFAVLLDAKDAGNRGRANALLDRSLGIARRQGARMLELKTCVTRCDIAGESDASKRQELQDLLNAMPEGHDTPDWQAAIACA